MLKPKQAVEKENEHWQCEFCGPELKRHGWTLGRITSQWARNQADSKRDGSESHLQYGVVSSPDTDVAVEDYDNGAHMLITPAKKNRK